MNLGTSQGARFIVNRSPLTTPVSATERLADFQLGHPMGWATLAEHGDFLYLAIDSPNPSGGMILKLRK